MENGNLTERLLKLGNWVRGSCVVIDREGDVSVEMPKQSGQGVERDYKGSILCGTDDANSEGKPYEANL